MNMHELVESRYSVRGYVTDRPVPQDILERILDAGRLAPSAKNLQPWKFLLVSSPEMRDRVCACYRGAWLRQAPHVLIVTGDRDAAWVRSFDGWNSLETDLAIAMDHLILAAHAEGLGTCWISAYDPAMLRDVLGLKPTEELFAITPLGYPTRPLEVRPKTRKTLDQVAVFL
ncbi:MAG TPA: nitroreductase family protein [Chlorobaculum sp.]|nr:nitroreductase family protein [Chlorobaculum sp.]